LQENHQILLATTLNVLTTKHYRAGKTVRNNVQVCKLLASKEYTNHIINAIIFLSRLSQIKQTAKNNKQEHKQADHLKHLWIAI